LSETKPHPRHLDWEGTFNARDSGGLATANGPIRHGALVRSDVLNGLTPAGVAALTDHGVRTVIDVRAAGEIADDWERYPLKGDGVVAYLNKPFRADVDAAMSDEMRAVYRSAQSREEINRADLDFHRRGIAGIVGAIADAPPGGVLVHCHAGKDRTGMVIALALAVVGVSDEDIADDYALTMLVIDRIMTEWLEAIGVTDEVERERLMRIGNPSREAMLDTLNYLRERYGGAERFLLDGGMTRDQIERLRARLVDTNGGAKAEDAA
jgi:protein tyrosine/serine phosphatase